MTAAPASIVAIKISCPGQSTNETCLISCRVVPQSGVVHSITSGLLELKDLKHCGAGQFGHLYNLALAYPSLIVMFLYLSL